MQFSTLKEALDYNSNFEDIIEESMTKITGINTFTTKTLDVVNFEIGDTLEFYNQYYEDSPIFNTTNDVYKIKTSIATPGYNMNNLVLADNTDNFINGPHSKLSNYGVTLEDGQGCCLRIKTDHPWYTSVIPDIFYNIYIANTDDTTTDYNGLINGNDYNSLQLNFIVGNGSNGMAFLDTIDLEFEETIGDLVSPTTGNVLPYLDTILNKLVIRKTETTSTMGKLNKLEIGAEKTNIIQIASNYKTTDTIILLNLNPITQTYPRTNNVIRFNSLIFVPIRTEIDEEKLEELLTKEIIKTKLLEKLT